PPVDTSRFQVGHPGEHYLVLSELMPHKRIELAIQAFNQLRLPLVVAGDGPSARRLRSLSGPNVRFAGRVTDAEVAHLLETCLANAARFDRSAFRRALPHEVSRAMEHSRAERFARPQPAPAPLPALRLARRGRTRSSSR